MAQDAEPNEARQQIVEFHRSRSRLRFRYRSTLSGTDIEAKSSEYLSTCRRTIMPSSADRNPKHHTEKMKGRLQETITHLREDIQKVDEPQLKAMFETSAEVLGGLVKAFGDYEKKNEAAWRKSA
jgi:hypothetical protein